MGREDKNIFLVVSSDKNKIRNISNSLVSKIPGASVFQASDWFDTKYKVDNVKPKILLIDEYLQKGSGAEIVGKILRDRNNDSIHIIIMSAVGDHDIFPHEVAAGRIQYLTESEREDSLLMAVNSYLKPEADLSGPQYQLKKIKAGEVLFNEGDRPEFVYIVRNGSLKAFTLSPVGVEIVLGEIKSGEFVGEMGHFNHEPRSATVQALTDVDLIEVPIHALESVIFAKPAWAKALVKTLAQRLKRVNTALKSNESVAS